MTAKLSALPTPSRAPERRAYHVPIQELASVWHLVRPGLEAVKKKTRPTWIQEEVFSICQQNRAWLVLGYCDDEFAGFSILSVEHDQFTGKHEPMVWIAYTTRKIDGMLEFVQGEMETRAKSMGFTHMIMHSPRPGWAKLAPKLGWKLRDCVYAKTL